GMAMVFQSYALYPHMSVRDNIGFPLKMAGVGGDEIKRKVDDAATVLKLDALLDRKPKALSGGQRQRVAIGRAIVREPSAFAFDEPLSNLDAALRVEMRFEIAKLHQQLGATMIYVTHDQVEAMTLADRIVVLQGGKVEQIGAPLDLYEKPDNLFVAQFIGSPKMNLMDCAASADGVSIAGNPVPTPSAEGKAPPTKLGIRPEHIDVVSADDGHLNGLVEVSEHLGSDTFLYVLVDGVGNLTVRSPGNVRVKSGDRIGLRFDPQRQHLFDQAGQAILH
ncbi:MAG: ATP-binding cassette domain-containing protein, partial [Pseudomonadota bacterium]